MKTLTVGEFKAKFSDVIEDLLSGEETTVTYGKKKEKIGVFVPYKKKKQKIKLGLLEGKASAKFAKDFKMTDEEFLAS
jgi:antitoxin (DNA-binding transcriptional repressor) of toxin-antitoxin stability system